MPGGTLPRRETELVILRVAHLRACRYEFAHHLQLARRSGVGPEDVLRVIEGAEAAGWSSREEAIVAAVDALHSSQDWNDETWDALTVHLDEREVIELCLLVGHYEMLATTIAALRIEPDVPRRRALDHA